MIKKEGEGGGLPVSFVLSTRKRCDLCYFIQVSSSHNTTEIHPEFQL